MSWEAFERADFREAAARGPTYTDFQVGSRLTGSVTTRDVRRLAGPLVFDMFCMLFYAAAIPGARRRREKRRDHGAPRAHRRRRGSAVRMGTAMGHGRDVLLISVIAHVLTLPLPS